MGQKLNATVSCGVQERIEGLRKSVAGVSQRLQAPKTLLGSEGVNVLQVLCDLLDLVQEMNTQLVEHVHGPTPLPSNAVAFGIAAASPLTMGTKLKLKKRQFGGFVGLR